MLVKTLLIALVSFIGFLECGVGNSMIQRPIVMGPLVGLVLGDVNAGLAVGATPVSYTHLTLPTTSSV